MSRITRNHIKIAAIAKAGWINEYCSEPCQNFLDKIVNVERVINQLISVQGNEYKSKIMSVLSSSALVANCFDPWSEYSEQMEITLQDSVSGTYMLKDFSKPQLEKLLPIGLSKSNTKANPDVWLDNETNQIAIEGKFCEVVDRKEPKFSPQYLDLVINDKFKQSPWVELMRQLIPERHFYYLDVAQLIKHYFGLMNCSGKGVKHLLYLYWHPSNKNWKELEPYKTHEVELRDFTKQVSKYFSDQVINIRFHSMTYQELWNQWDSLGILHVSNHVQALRDRYEFSVNL